MSTLNIDVLMAEVIKDISYIKAELVNNRAEHKEILDTVKSFVASAEDKYAPKWVENALIWGIRLVIGAVLLAIIGLVLTIK